jgi:hypothetical protein
LSRSASEIGLPLAIEVAAGKGDGVRVLVLIREMLRSANVIKERADGAIGNAEKLFDRKNLSLEETLRDLCAENNINPLAGRYLIGEIWRKKARPGCEEALDSVAHNRPLWAEAADRYLEILGAEKPGWLAEFIDKNAETLAEHTDTWASVGYHLTTMSDNSRMSQWFAGWEKRSGLRPWMLWNYTTVLRRDGLTAEADRVNRAAIDLPYDNSVNGHLTAIGLAAFGRGDLDEARGIFSNINPLTMSDWDRFLYDILGDALAAAGSVASGDPASARSITDGMVSNVIKRDPKQADRLIKDAVHAVLVTIFTLIGSRWYTLLVKAKLFYYSLG